MCVTYIEGISRHSHVRYYYLLGFFDFFCTLGTSFLYSLFSLCLRLSSSPFHFKLEPQKNRLFVVLKTLLSSIPRANIFPSTVKTDFWFVVDMRGWLTGGAVEKEEVWSSSDGFLCLFIASLSTFFHMVGSVCVWIAMRCTEHRKSSSLFSLSLPSRGFVSSQLRCRMDVYESLNVPVLIVSLYRDGYIRILYVRTTHTAAAARIYNISSRLVTSFTSKEKETTSPSILFFATHLIPDPPPWVFLPSSARSCRST